MNGGYDVGYANCLCFWGREPGSLVKRLAIHVPEMYDLDILDAGCGEGKNAAYLGNLGARVKAVDCSSLAIANAKATWTQCENISWEVANIQTLDLPISYDIVVAYGLLHCLNGADEVSRLVEKLKDSTLPAGFHVVCAFNSRFQQLEAHPGFHPCLLSHTEYLAMYEGWEILEQSDSDLTETHPHNQIEHTHSMTRIITRKPS